MNDEIYHHGIKGRKWGIRNEDERVTSAERMHYITEERKNNKDLLSRDISRHQDKTDNRMNRDTNRTGKKIAKIQAKTIITTAAIAAATFITGMMIHKKSDSILRQSDIFQDDTNFLTHWGIKGMRWGIRKQDQRVSSAERMYYAKMQQQSNRDRLNAKLKMHDSDNLYKSNRHSDDTRLEQTKVRANYILRGVRIAAASTLAGLKIWQNSSIRKLKLSRNADANELALSRKLGTKTNKEKDALKKGREEKKETTLELNKELAKNGIVSPKSSKQPVINVYNTASAGAVIGDINHEKKLKHSDIFQEDASSLTHWGVKGMHWGIRRWIEERKEKKEAAERKEREEKERKEALAEIKNKEDDLKKFNNASAKEKKQIILDTKKQSYEEDDDGYAMLMELYPSKHLLEEEDFYKYPDDELIDWNKVPLLGCLQKLCDGDYDSDTTNGLFLSKTEIAYILNDTRGVDDPYSKMTDNELMKEYYSTYVDHLKERYKVKHGANEDNSATHSGILGMKWGIRRYQNPDGTLTSAGKARYSQKTGEELDARDMSDDELVSATNRLNRERNYNFASGKQSKNPGYKKDIARKVSASVLGTFAASSLASLVYNKLNGKNALHGKDLAKRTLANGVIAAGLSGIMSLVNSTGGITSINTPIDNIVKNQQQSKKEG